MLGRKKKSQEPDLPPVASDPNKPVPVRERKAIRKAEDAHYRAGQIVEKIEEHETTPPEVQEALRELTEAVGRLIEHVESDILTPDVLELELRMLKDDLKDAVTEAIEAKRITSGAPRAAPRHKKKQEASALGCIVALAIVGAVVWIVVTMMNAQAP